MPIEYISVKEYALRNGLSERTVRNYCANGRIEGAVLVGKTWSLPADAVVAEKSKKSAVSPLLHALREQMEMRLKGGIYHRTQIDLTYNSNHIEGSLANRDRHFLPVKASAHGDWSLPLTFSYKHVKVGSINYHRK